MEIIYRCSGCGKPFDDRKQCELHEEKCLNDEITFVCDRCGKNERAKIYNIESNPILNRYHDIFIGEIGYGSVFDNVDIEFTVCDDCLASILDEFKNKNIILSK